MNEICCPLTSKEILDIYFLENRARLLEIASFLDRIERSRDQEFVNDYRYKGFMKGLEIIINGNKKEKIKSIQLILSDLSTEPIDSAIGLKAHGAWEKAFYEDH